MPFGSRECRQGRLRVGKETQLISATMTRGFVCPGQPAVSICPVRAVRSNVTDELNQICREYRHDDRLRCGLPRILGPGYYTSQPSIRGQG